MSDLISRSELLKRFLVNKDGHRIPERDCDNFEVTVSIKDVKPIIKEQPTAYDIDMVVAELEESFFKIEQLKDIDVYKYITTKVIELKDAIEIAQAGCVSDDCCEWEPHRNNYVTSCEEDFVPMMRGYKYCPYCGKR